MKHLYFEPKETLRIFGHFGGNWKLHFSNNCLFATCGREAHKYTYDDIHKKIILLYPEYAEHHWGIYRMAYEAGIVIEFTPQEDSEIPWEEKL